MEEKKGKRKAAATVKTHRPEANTKRQHKNAADKTRTKENKKTQKIKKIHEKEKNDIKNKR
jgi:hypothetical protein